MYSLWEPRSHNSQIFLLLRLHLFVGTLQLPSLLAFMYIDIKKKNQVFIFWWECEIISKVQGKTLPKDNAHEDKFPMAFHTLHTRIILN